MAKITITLDKLIDCISTTHHFRGRVKDRLHGRNVNTFKKDVIKSIHRYRISKDKYTGMYIVIGGLGTYVMSQDLCIVTVMEPRRYDQRGARLVPLTHEEKMKLLDTIWNKIRENEKNKSDSFT